MSTSKVPERFIADPLPAEEKGESLYEKNIKAIRDKLKKDQGEDAPAPKTTKAPPKKA